MQCFCLTELIGLLACSLNRVNPALHKCTSPDNQPVHFCGRLIGLSLSFVTREAFAVVAATASTDSVRHQLSGSVERRRFRLRHQRR